MLLQFLGEVVVILSSLLLSTFLRTHIQVGQSVSEPINVSSLALLITLLLWGIVFGIRNNRRLLVPDSKILIVLITVILTAIQYYILLNTGVPTSRLLLAYMLFLNCLAVIYAPFLATFFVTKYKDVDVRIISSGLSRKLYVARADLWVALVIGLFWAAYVVLLGVFIVGDSFSYIKVAMDTLLSGRLEFHQLPPFWPLIISFGAVITPFLGDIAAYSSAICVLLTFVVMALILRKLTQNALVNIAFIVLLGSLGDFLDLFFYGLTEPLYILLTLTAYYLILLHKSGDDIKYFFAALLFAALASITRFMGIALVVLVILYWLFPDGGVNFPRRLPTAVLYALVALSPFVYLIWLDAITKSANVAVVTGLPQAESGQLFIYTLGFSSLLNVFTDFLRSFWNSLAGLPYLIVSLFVLLVGFFLGRNFSGKDKEWFWTNQLFSIFFLVLTLVSIAFSGSVPVTRYWMPALPFIFFAFAQGWSVVLAHLMHTTMQQRKFYWFAQFFVTMLFGSALFLQIRSSTTSVSNSWRARSNLPVHQSLMGFNISSTAQGFQQFLRQASVDYDYVTLFMIDGDLDGEWTLDPIQGWVWKTSGFGIDSSVARPFVLKSSLFPEEFSDFEFTLFEEDEQVVHYTFDDVRRQITMVVATGGAPLADQLNSAKAISASANHGLFLVANENLLTQIEENLTDFTKQFMLVREIEPYRVFIFNGD